MNINLNDDIHSWDEVKINHFIRYVFDNNNVEHVKILILLRDLQRIKSLPSELNLNTDILRRAQLNVSQVIVEDVWGEEDVSKISIKNAYTPRKMTEEVYEKDKDKDKDNQGINYNKMVNNNNNNNNNEKDNNVWTDSAESIKVIRNNKV